MVSFKLSNFHGMCLFLGSTRCIKSNYNWYGISGNLWQAGSAGHLGLIWCQVRVSSQRLLPTIQMLQHQCDRVDTVNLTAHISFVLESFTSLSGRIWLGPHPTSPPHHPLYPHPTLTPTLCPPPVHSSPKFP